MTGDVFFQQLWPSFIFMGIAAVCAYHVVKGLRTGTINLPISILVFQDFDRDRSAANFWGILVVDALMMLGAAGVAIYAGVHGL